MGRDGKGWKGMGRDGKRWEEIERDGKGWEGMERDGKRWKGMERDGKRWKGMERDGKEVCSGTEELSLAKHYPYFLSPKDKKAQLQKAPKLSIRSFPA